MLQRPSLGPQTPPILGRSSLTPIGTSPNDVTTPVMQAKMMRMNIGKIVEVFRLVFRAMSMGICLMLMIVAECIIVVVVVLHCVLIKLPASLDAMV